MPEYRQDPLTGRTVIVAEERASRPHQFDIEESVANGDADGTYRKSCPFCEGNEGMTPGEIAAFRPPGALSDTPGWTVRTIPNKYPAVIRRDDEFPDRLSFCDRYEAFPPHETQFHRVDARYLEPIPGVGNHEVIVDTPRHVLSVSDMDEREVAEMLRMYRQRLLSLHEEDRWACVQIFKNVGAAAGASIPHSHSQLIAMPFVPPGFRSMLSRARQYRNTTKQHRSGPACFWCDQLEFELRDRSRIVEETSRFVVLCPFVSRFAAEVEIYPKEHVEHFEETENAAAMSELAKLLRRTVMRLEKAVFWMKGRLAYNFVLHTKPFELPFGDTHVFHWHLSILPSLARAAGFEWGTGLHINPISPESAAQRLREISLY